MGDSQPRRLEERVVHELGRLVGMLALALIQVTLLSTPLGFSVSLVLIVVISGALLSIGAAFPDVGVQRVLRWALYGGLTLDILAATYLGTHALALLTATLVVVVLARRIRIEGIMIPLLAVLIASVIYELVLALLINRGMIEWQTYALIIILPSILITLIPTLPIFFLVRWLLRNQL
ncbi:rod shape-determining protein MreD [Candidatus Chloroploca sp. Khr17]|uniref:rod shape-determining protein MreD n=1 Tax=Candidatus Chloroploca sp. Khr17 TaxID=2496869 RepID=UPI00101BAAE5|nr:rod shape-determining protein MreD [Candidatus Chloroploca sp. Khr17]